MLRSFAAALLLALLLVPSPFAHAQEGCPPVGGITCDGYITDAAGVITDDARLEEAAGRIIEATGNEVAVVIVDGAPGGDPARFAIDVGNEWGVGNAARDDGIVVVVDIGARRTEIQTGPGASLPNTSFLASLGDSFFGGGDFDAGVLAILGGIESTLVDGPGEVSSPGGATFNPVFLVFLFVIGLVTVVSVGAAVQGIRATRKAVAARRAEDDPRKELVDLRLARLEPAGHEIVLGTDFLVPQPELEQDVPTSAGVRVLRSVVADEPIEDGPALRALFALDVVDVLDEELIARYRTMPLELVVTEEQQLLEDAVQDAASVARRTEEGPELDVRLAELDRLVASLKPYRVAEATTRRTRQLAMEATDSPIGPLVLTDLGERFHQSSPVLEAEQPLSASVEEVSAAYALAVEKTDRVARIRANLHDKTSAGAVSVALADVDADVDGTLAEYERLLERLEDSEPAKDGVSVPALAAFLLMNNDETAVADFLAAYREARTQYSAGTSVEYALAGVQGRAEIAEARAAADDLGLPVAIAVALTRRGGRAVATFRDLEERLVQHKVTGDNRRTIAALLALSLEPAVALERWLDARRQLALLGLQGAYADVAAAFGASDPRGPRSFAIAYAAQRQALARSGVEDADRFAPELAHGGTSGRTDTWTGQRIPGGLTSYDPFTFLYFHWIITGGTGYGNGWAPIYRDHSWSGDHDSWFGGGGGFGSSGGWSGGSTWGSSWGSGGGFGGFSGGGGFGGGGGFSGGSGW